ncbi:penicillin-binding transpeptidase domain-containing protein [Streptomyces sp. NPDC051578]|uniref:penicillin-binding transpeptidase domain-containing protein n=1 Tax=Streptomyces sp. NPDC051578 TaxID=3365662 RepID=UPI0037AC236B
MPVPSRPRVAVLVTLLTLVSADLSGCSSEHPDVHRVNPSGAAGTAEAKPPAPKPAAAPGDILVGGRPVTGTVPSGHAKFPFRRTYTDGELYAPVTGYRSLAFGNTQLESIRREDLDAGKDVATTIDPLVQRAAFDALRGRTGAAVALDARTGEIVALVSTPSYDPNSFSGYATSDAKAWKQLNADAGKPLYNRSLRDLHNPGSAAHIIVAAAALEKGLLASVDAPTRTPAVHTVPDSSVQFSGDPAHCTDASLRAALRHACQNVFARLATNLGAETLAATAESFGFNTEQMDTPARAFESRWPRQPGNAAQLALTANGLFDTTATPLQMAIVMGAIGNGGNWVSPRMVTDPKTPAPSRRAVSEHTAEQLRLAVGSSVNAWVPSASGTWAMAHTQARGGSHLAVAVFLSSGADATAEAAQIAERIVKAAKH